MVKVRKRSHTLVWSELCLFLKMLLKDYRETITVSESICESKLLHVSIVSYGSSLPLLLSAINSILVSLGPLKCLHSSAAFSITLVDNSDLNELKQENFSSLKEDMARVSCELKLIQGQGNVGYGRGQNLAFNAQHAKYHLFMNPDVELDPECLRAGISYLEKNKDVAIGSPYATDMQGNKQYLCKRYPTVLDLLIRGLAPELNRYIYPERAKRYEIHDLSETEPTKHIPIVSGCFMLCRSKVIREISGFDHKYFLYFEDFNLSLRAGEIASIAYLPAMRIKHTGGNASKKGPAHIKYFLRSAFQFFSTHGWQWL